jgi:hypothetical protein
MASTCTGARKLHAVATAISHYLRDGLGCLVAIAVAGLV